MKQKKNKHKEKVRIATKLNGGKRKGMFLSDAWEARREAIAKRVKKQSVPTNVK